MNFFKKIKIFFWLKKHCNINGYTSICNDKIYIYGSIRVKETNGKLPYAFGHIYGNFCIASTGITTLENCPDFVTGTFDCGINPNLKSLKYGPETVKGSFCCDYCTKLESLKYSPKYIGKSFHCSNCDSLTNLIGSPVYINNDYVCCSCKNLKSITGCTRSVGNSIIISNNMNLDNINYIKKLSQYKFILFTNCPNIFNKKYKQYILKSLKNNHIKVFENKSYNNDFMLIKY